MTYKSENNVNHSFFITKVKGRKVDGEFFNKDKKKNDVLLINYRR